VSDLPSFILCHPLARIVVKTRSEVVEKQLRTRLEPYVQIHSGSTDPSDEEERPDLVVIASTAAAALPPGPSIEVMIRDDQQFERYRRPADLWTLPQEHVMHERKNASVFRWSTEGPANVAVANSDEAALAKSVRRLVQDFIRLRAWHLGGIIVEASTISVEGLGLLAVGGRGTGKTTLLARFLEIGAGMVSNDEVALFPGEGGITAHGFPMLVNTRPPLIESFPQLRGLANFTLEGRDPKAPVRYNAFAHALGGHIEADVSRLVGVLLTPDLEGARDVDPGAFSSALMANILSGPGWHSPWRLLPPGFPEPDLVELKRRVARIVDEVPAITVGRLHTPANIADAAQARLTPQVA